MIRMRSILLILRGIIRMMMMMMMIMMVMMMMVCRVCDFLRSALWGGVCTIIVHLPYLVPLKIPGIVQKI